MVLETLQPGAPASVKTLAEISPLNPDSSQVTEIDFQNILRRINERKEYGVRAETAEYAAGLCLLFHEKREQIVEGLSLDLLLPRSTRYNADYYKWLKIMFPDSDPTTYEETPETMPVNLEIKEKIESVNRGETPEVSVYMIIGNWERVITLFPGILDPKNISPEFRKRVVAEAEQDLGSGPKDIDALHLWSELLSVIPKGIFPGLNLDLRELEEKIKRDRKNGDWEEFLRSAVALKVLKADQVVITADGWNFNMPESSSFQKPAPPIPEARKF